jgi:hypothetical protein
LLVDDNDRQICQLVFGDDVPDCTREIVAIATRGRHELDRLLRLSGGADRPVQGERCNRGQQFFLPLFFFRAVLTPESGNRLTRLR